MRTSTFVFAFCGVAALALGQNPCEKLKSLETADAVFTTVELVPAGPVPSAAGRGGAAPAGRGAAPAAAAPAGRGAAPAAAGGRGAAAPAQLPAYCHVAATLKPSSDSYIKMELY